MVKFGRHQKYFLEHEHRDDSFVVPYNKTKSQIEEDSVEFTADDFVKQWQNYLEQARQEFDTSVGRAWQRVFATLHDVHTEEARGAPPEKALVLFATTAPSQKTVVEVLDIFKSIHATALVNAEALRKLVKKFDKHQLKQAADNADSSSSSTMESLSCQLLPQVYAANFVVGLASIHQAVELLRSELGLGEYAAATTNTEAEAQLEMTPSSTTTTCLTSPKHKPSATSKRNFMPSPGFPSDRDEKKDDPNNNNGQPQQQQQVVLDSKTAADENIPIDDGASMEQAMGGLQFQRLTLQDRKDSHAEHTELVDRRRLELQWLRQSIQRIDQFGFCANLVAHRGFHSPKDRSDRRPLENSLQAYETAWTSGIHLCECVSNV